MADWYTDNANRDWPFVNRVEPITQYDPDTSSSASSEGLYVHLPHSAVVDFGAIMEIDAGFKEDSHYVYLRRVSRLDATTFEFEFRATSPEVANHKVLFTRQTTDAPNMIEWQDAVPVAALESAALSCEFNPRWQAFMVSGNMDDLVELLAEGEDLYFSTGLWQIEPSRVQSLLDSYLRAVNLANYPRSLATLAEDCNSVSAAAEEIILRAQCVRGDLQWKEGYNCAIRQDVFDNAIVISAALGSGEGEPCEEVERFADETPPAGSPFLSGGPGCSDIVKSINGISGRRLTFVSGPGIRIYAAPDDSHKLVIDRSLEDFALCLVPEPAPSSSLSSSSLSSSEGGA